MPEPKEPREPKAKKVRVLREWVSVQTADGVVTIEQGEVTDLIPAKSLKWLLSDGTVEEV